MSKITWKFLSHLQSLIKTHNFFFIFSKFETMTENNKQIICRSLWQQMSGLLTFCKKKKINRKLMIQAFAFCSNEWRITMKIRFIFLTHFFFLHCFIIMLVHTHATKSVKPNLSNNLFDRNHWHC